MYIWNLEEKLDKVEGNDNTYDREPWSVFFVEENVILDKKNFFLTKPEMTALYVDMSDRLFSEAIQFFNQNNFDYNKWFYHVKDRDLYFKFIQNISWSIIFAVNSLECFCNTLLINFEDSKIMGKEKNKRGEEKDFTKKDLEWRSIDRKVWEFLQQYFNIKFREKTWNDFLKLKNLRDRLTHLKWADIKTWSSPISEKNIWRSLVKQTKESPSSIIIDLINQLYDNDNLLKQPRWLRLYLEKKEKIIW